MVFPSVSSSLKARSSLADQPTWVAHDGDRSAGHHAGGREGLWYSGSSSSRRNRAHRSGDERRSPFGDRPQEQVGRLELEEALEQL